LTLKEERAEKRRDYAGDYIMQRDPILFGTLMAMTN
jgi:hypothetical protein